MEARGKYLSSLVILLSLVGDIMGAKTCTVADIFQCLATSLSGSETPSHFSPGTWATEEHYIEGFCRSEWPKYRECMDEALDACQSSTDVFTLLASGSMGALEYTCSDANIDEFAQLSQCLDSRSSALILRACQYPDITENVIYQGVCSVISNYRSCLRKSVAMICDEQSGQFMDGFILHVLRAVLGDESANVFSLCNIDGVNPV